MIVFLTGLALATYWPTSTQTWEFDEDDPTWPTNTHKWKDIVSPSPNDQAKKGKYIYYFVVGGTIVFAVCASIFFCFHRKQIEETTFNATPLL